MSIATHYENTLQQIEAAQAILISLDVAQGNENTTLKDETISIVNCCVIGMLEQAKDGINAIYGEANHDR